MNNNVERIEDHQSLVKVTDKISQIQKKVADICKAINDEFLGDVYLGRNAVVISPVQGDPFSYQVTTAGKVGRLVCEIQIAGNEIIGVVTLWKPVTTKNGTREHEAVWGFAQPVYSAPYCVTAAGRHNLDFQADSNRLAYELGLTFFVRFANP